MAAATNGTGAPRRGGTAVIAISAILAAGLGGLTLYLRHGASRAEGQLTRYREEYDKMIRMKRQLDEFRRNIKLPPPTEKGNEDLLQLLGPKARQANIPQNAITITRNPDRKEGGWKEVSYAVTLRAPSKENPLLKAAVVDFLGLVEKERPSVKAKSLSLTYAGDSFTAASVTFSLFQRESP